MSTKPLSETLAEVGKQWESDYGPCFMCTSGDEPTNGFHHHKSDRYSCLNDHGGCLFCKDAVADAGESCAVCHRVFK